MLALRPYQTDAVVNLRQLYVEGHRSPLLVIPTGGGKTVIFSHIGGAYVPANKRVLILVHRIELLRQTSAALTKNGIRHGLINSKYTPTPDALVQVASVQTLVKRMDRVQQDWDLIICDECHHTRASTYRIIIDANPRARLLGVTATPIRSDGSGLGVKRGGYFDSIVIGPQPSELIRLGYLVKPKVFAPKTKLDLSDVDFLGGDYNKGQVLAKVDKPTITGDAVEHYSRLCPGEPCVVFCVTVAHAEHVAEQFLAAGYRAAHVDGGLDDDERDRRLSGLATGAYQVITSADLISEGTDIPAIACAIMLRPTASLGLYIQQVGRALRPSPGKEFAIILDHVGNTLLHGMPDEDRQWTLDGDKVTKKSVSQTKEKMRVMQCPNCYAMHLPAPSCDECGHFYVTVQRETLQVDGELAEITGDILLQIKKQRAREVAMARTYPELLEIESRRGYAQGWAGNVWASRKKKELEL